MPLTTTITPEDIKALIKSELSLKQDFPMDMNFHELGFTNQQLKRIQMRFVKSLNRTVSTIFFSDTILTLTARLLK